MESSNLIREDPDNPGQAVNFLADKFEHVDGTETLVMTGRELKIGLPFRSIQVQQISQFGLFGPILLDHLVELSYRRWPDLVHERYYTIPEPLRVAWLNDACMAGHSAVDCYWQYCQGIPPKNDCLAACKPVWESLMKNEAVHLASLASQALLEGTQVDFLLTQR